MKARSPAWIIAAGLVLVQASGILSLVGQGISGLDQAVTGIIDLKKAWKTIVPLPQFPTIQPVMIPKQNKPMPKKVAKQ